MHAKTAMEAILVKDSTLRPGITQVLTRWEKSVVVAAMDVVIVEVVLRGKTETWCVFMMCSLSFHGGSRHGDVNSSVDGTNFKASFCIGNAWKGWRPDVQMATRYLGRPLMGDVCDTLLR